MTTEVKILRKMREILTPPGAWIQRAYAKKANGEACFPSNPEAICFCLRGALHRAQMPFPEYYIHLGTDPMYDLMKVDESWNDQFGRTQEEVLAKIDETIARLE